MRLNLNNFSGSDRSKNKISKWVVTAIALIGLLVVSLNMRTLIILAPYIRTGLGIDEGSFGYLNSALMIGALLSTLPISMLLGRFSTRRAYGTILAIVAVILFITSIQSNFYVVLGMLFLLGISASGIIPLANRVIAENFDQTNKGVLTAFIFSAVPLGGFLGAIAFPPLGEKFDWGAGYQALAVISIIGSVLAWTMLPDHAGSAGPQRTKVKFSELRSVAFILIAVSYGIFDIVIAGSEYYTTLYFVDVVKVSSVLAGTLFGLIQVSAIGGRIFWGFIGDRFFYKNRYWLLFFTSAITLISTIIMVLLTPSSPIWLIGLVLVLNGVSGASSWVILCALLSDVVGVALVANATAAVLFVATISDMLGPIIFGNLIEITGTYQQAFYIFIAINILVLIGYFGLAMQRKRQITVGTVESS